MAAYTPDQLELYLAHIGLSRSGATPATDDQLATLTRLQQHHLARVPFENISLHYSPCRMLSLDPQDLFKKIVVNGRGGYCMEVNALFGNILRTLGFHIISVGARVTHHEWCHMLNMVTIADQKYLVDVGFGRKEPTSPVPLRHGVEFPIMASTRGRLDFKHLDAHSAAAKDDPSQRLWVFSARDSAHDPWEEIYSFAATEFFPEDFEMMSYFVSTRPESWFVQEVVAYRLVMDETGGGALVGEVTLHRDSLTIRHVGKEEVVRKLNSEKERVDALELYFQIVLTDREQSSIKGLVSAIK